jgi:hypothetical protein
MLPHLFTLFICPDCHDGLLFFSNGALKVLILCRLVLLAKLILTINSKFVYVLAYETPEDRTIPVEAGRFLGC